MRVQIVNLIRVDAGIAHGIDHGPARAIQIGRGHVTGVGTHAKAGQFGINLRTPCFGVFVFFEHHHAATFAQNKPVSITVPWPRCGGGIVISSA